LKGLKGYGDGKIIISPDESLEERRKRMLKRLKFRAERDGNYVSVENGILLVDGVPVFFYLELTKYLDLTIVFRISSVCC